MEQKIRRADLIKRTAAWTAALLIYYIFMQFTGISIPCLFHKITGYRCPGCGITHMAVDMLHFKFAEAFADNPLLFFMIPFLALLLVVKIIFLPPQLENGSRFLNVTLSVCIGLLLIFGVVRNIAGI